MSIIKIGCVNCDRLERELENTKQILEYVCREFENINPLAFSRLKFEIKINMFSVEKEAQNEEEKTENRNTADLG